jgi:hypothetical protein
MEVSVLYTAGLEISCTGPSDKMSDDFELNICMMMFGSEITLNDIN